MNGMYEELLENELDCAIAEIDKQIGGKDND
jgi:hypothetical protein